MKYTHIIRILEIGLCIGAFFILVIVDGAKSFGQGMELDTDRLGSDFRDFDLPLALPELCQTICATDSNCKAWTYVKPSYQGQRARCWLKNSVPNPSRNTCCISGVKTTGTEGGQTPTNIEPQETTSPPQSSGISQRSILPDGTVEIRYPDGTIKRLSTGGITIISPNGQTKKYYYYQVQPDTPPSLPSDAQTFTWLEAHNENLLVIIRSLVSNDQTAIDNYLQYEGTSSNLYEKINKRTQTIDYLLSP